MGYNQYKEYKEFWEERKMEGVKVGDICKVVNDSFTYPTYDDFARKAGHIDIANNDYFEDEVVKGMQVRVLYIAPHEYESRIILAIVETTNSPKYFKFIISVKGLILVRECVLNTVVQDYLSGIPLTRIIPDIFVDELLIQAIIGRNPLDLQYINATLLTDKHYKSVLRKDGGLLGLLPEARRTLSLCRIAIKEEPYAQKFIPEELRCSVI